MTLMCLFVCLFICLFIYLFIYLRDHFTVVCLASWPLNGSKAGGHLVLTQSITFLLCKSSCSYTDEKQSGLYQSEVILSKGGKFLLRNSGAASVGVFQDNLVLSIGLIM